MGKISRRKSQNRPELAGRRVAQSRRRATSDRADLMAATRSIHANNAKGTLIGDHGVQINYFLRAAADPDAMGSYPVQADLPAASKVFVGRDADLAELLGLLDPAAAATAPRVAVVSGMAGAGKSELVLHAAHAAVRNGWFPGGVLFATLHGGDLDLAQIALDGFLSAMGVPGDSVPAELEARSRLFSSVISQYAKAGKPVLVVIDNAVSAGQCELLVPADGAAVITSRNELPVLDARLLRLPVLGDEAGADLLAGQLGVSLGADTRVTDHRDDARAIAGLCGGLPLALRIVAAILAENQTRSLAAVAADLLDARTRLDELEWERGGEMLAVRAAFDMSYRGLGPLRARIFRLLAVNPGPEISTSAAAVLTDLEERAVRRHLESLAGTHLIERGSADGRWRMHDLIRLYAAEQLPDDTNDAWAGLLIYYMNTANEATSQLTPATYPRVKSAFTGRADALAWLDREYPNLAAIVLLPVPAVEFADVALGLWRYFELRRRINDGIMLTGHALLTVRRVGDRAREARAQANLAGLFRQGRMFDAAIAAGQAAVAAYRSEGDQEGVGIALNNLAAAQAAAGEFEETVRIARQAVAIFRPLGDRHREAIALGHIAIALEATGQFTEGIAAYQDILAVMRKAGDRRGEGVAQLNLGSTLKEADRLDEAIVAEEEAVAIFTELGDRWGEGTALNNLGGMLRMQNREREAIPLLRAAVDELTGADDAHTRGAALINLGQALIAEGGHYDEAITAFTNGAADYRETGDRSHEGAAERHRGRALREAGRPDEAAEAFRTAAAIAQDTGDHSEEGRALSLLAGVLPPSQREEAVAALERAVALFRESGDTELEQTATNDLLSLGLPVPSVAELRARIDAASIETVVPGLYVDVTVLGGPEDEEGQQTADEIRAMMRKIAADAVDESPHEKRESADSPEPRPDRS